MPARALKTLDVEIARAKAHFGVPASVSVCSCYEAGRDGFWLQVWSVVNVPTPIEEDRLQVHRELLFVRRDRGRHTNRMKGLLASQGVPLAKLREFPTHGTRHSAFAPTQQIQPRLPSSSMRTSVNPASVNIARCCSTSRIAIFVHSPSRAAYRVCLPPL